jgi:protein ImuB
MTLWLCIRLPQLAREALAVQSQPAAGQVSANTSVLQVQRAALERLAGWAYQWSSLVSYDPAEPLLWLELGASSALFGAPAVLLARIESGLADLGYSHVCSLAPSPTAAALLTRAPERQHAFDRRQLRSCLAPLPLQLLDLPDPVLAALASSGLRRIGEVLDLPAAAIARRFEPSTWRYLQRLSASIADPRPAWRLPSSYRSRCQFDVEVHSSTALLFPLQRLLLEFQGYLRARDCGVLHFTLRFEHWRQPASCLRIGLSAPGREAAQFLTLARERMHSLQLPAGVSALGIEALEFTAPAIVQTDLFGQDAQPLQQLQRLLDRLRARLGDDSVGALELTADHRPEHGWRLRPPERALALAGSAGNPAAPPRPCWLLPEPLPIETPAMLLRGPERLEGGWWEGADVRRDYYLAGAAEGSQLWVFQDRRSGHWYLQGLWS